MLSHCIEAFSQNRYAIYFTDKNNSSYSFSNPLAYLSQRALNRRAKQNIAIDSLDLPVNTAYVQGVAATGATILNVSKWLNCVTIQTSSSTVLTAINALPYVKSNTNVGRMPVNISGLSKQPFDKFKNETLSNTASTNANKVSSLLNYGASYTQVHQCNGDALHDGGFQGQGMLISIMDAGFLHADTLNVFDSLWAQNKIVAVKDFVNPLSNIYNEFFHGAACFSILAANSPGAMMGTAPQASYLLLRTEDANTENIIEEYNWAAAAEYADSAGADVFSTSLGYTTFDIAAQNHTYASMDGNTTPITIAADIAASRGIVAVNSAGNDGNSAWNFIGAPADANNILAIGAVNGAGSYASFSSNGPTYDGRVKPDVSAMGSGTTICNPNSGSITTGSGTSYSCPVVAGLTACLWQKFPTRTAMEVVDAIRRSGSIYAQPDTLIGYGIPNFTTASAILTANATFTGPTTVCKNDIVSYSASPGLSSYNWTVPSGGIIQGSNNSNLISIKWTTSGNHSVSLSITSGIYSDSKSLNVKVLATPTATITANGPTVFCKPSTVTLTANSGTGLTYAWIKGTAAITGATSIAYNVSQSGNYKCIVTNNVGCTKASNAISITANALPTATIQTVYPISFCAGDSAVLNANSGAGFTYQWLKGTNTISGANNVNYAAKTTGAYKCIVTNANTCSRTSNKITISVICKEDETLLVDGDIHFYPNPVSDNVSIEFTADENESTSISIFDITGRVIIEKEFDSTKGINSFEINTQGMTSGVYVLKLKGNGSEKSLKLMKE